MDLMINSVRPYAWGSRTAIAELLGDPTPSPHPQAELWIGGHPADSSVLDTPDGPRPLHQVIAEDPVGQLGSATAERYGARLPFLLKVLAAAEPLSLQAHPSAEQAAAGFAAEEAEGIPVRSPNRNYKDSSHKPELICALTEFHALCGFAEPAKVVHLMASLKVPALEHYIALLSWQPDEHGMRALFSTIVTLPSSALEPLLQAVVAGCVARLGDTRDPELTAHYRTALELAERYPGDCGAIAALMMNRITLQPGEALYLSAGNLHAYLSGVGVEIMANSDNVLRGGLTPKHVDVPELMKVLDFSAGDREILRGESDGHGETVYRTPVAEFELSRLVLTDGMTRELYFDAPQVIFCTDGRLTLESVDGNRVDVVRGRSVWLPAGAHRVTVSGEGVAFRATVGTAER